jgi:hypothetical protein
MTKKMSDDKELWELRKKISDLLDRNKNLQEQIVIYKRLIEVLDPHTLTGRIKNDC